MSLIASSFSQAYYRLTDIISRSFRQSVSMPSVRIDRPGYSQPIWFIVIVVGALIFLGRRVCNGTGSFEHWALLVVASAYAIYLIVEWFSILKRYTGATATSPVELLLAHSKPLRRHVAHVFEASNLPGSILKSEDIDKQVDSLMQNLKAAAPWTKVAIVLIRRIGVNFVLTVFTLSTIQMSALVLESPVEFNGYAEKAGGYAGVLTDYVLSQSVVLLGSQSSSPPAHQATISQIFLAAQNFYLTWFLSFVIGAALVTAAVVESATRDTEGLEAHFQDFLRQRLVLKPEGPSQTGPLGSSHAEPLQATG